MKLKISKVKYGDGEFPVNTGEPREILTYQPCCQAIQRFIEDDKIRITYYGYGQLGAYYHLESGCACCGTEEHHFQALGRCPFCGKDIIVEGANGENGKNKSKTHSG